MQFQLSPKLKKELSVVKNYGYRNEQDFVKDAIWHRIFEFKSAVKLTPAQKRDLENGRKELARGEFFTLEQLKHDLGITH